MMDIKWADNVSQGTYIAHLRVESQDRVGILKDILIKIADTNTNIAYANTYLKSKKFGIMDIGVELSDIDSNHPGCAFCKAITAKKRLKYAK